MVSGSRSISICKAAVSKCSPAIPRDYREPLLFLYPKWARGFASTATELVRDEKSPHHTRPASELQQVYSPLAGRHNTYALDARYDSQDCSTKLCISNSKAKAKQGRSHLETNKDADKNKEPILGRAPEGHAIARRHKQEFRIRPASLRPVTCRGHQHNKPKTPIIRGAVRKLSAQAHQQDDPGAAMIRRIARRYPIPYSRPELDSKTTLGERVQKILSMAERSEFRWFHEEEIRRMKNENANKDRDIPEKHPNEVFDFLIRHTPKRAGGTTLRISVPSTAVETLLFGVDSNIIDIKNQTGCDIELLESDEGKSTRILVLSGPPICISVAASQIFRVVPTAMSESVGKDFTFSQYSTQTKNTEPLGVRFKLFSGKTNNIPRRADSIPKPEILSKPSLELYIRSLTRITMTSSLHRTLYGRYEDHVDMVRQKLLEVFASKECMDVMSITALNEAVLYLVNQGRISAVREVYDKTLRAGFPVTTETFNIILRGCAKSRNMNIFAAILEAMVQRGCHPNSETWRAFMMLVQEPKAIFQVFTAMQERGFFHEEGVLRDVCEILIPHEMDFWLDKNILVDGIIEHMTSRYGNGWLTLSGANKILDKLGQRGLLSECWSFVEYMLKQNIKPNSVSINTIFTYTIDIWAFAASLKSLRRISNQLNFVPDGVTYEILFKLAWRLRCYATARVIWQHACLDGCVTFEMRKRVTNSLKAAFLFQNTAYSSPSDRTSPQESPWELTAGLFVTKGIRNTAPRDRDEVSDATSIRIWQAHHLATKTVDSDLMLFKYWMPRSSVTRLLVASIKRDYHVAKFTDLSFERTMMFLLKYAPVVTMKRRGSNKETGLRKRR